VVDQQYLSLEFQQIFLLRKTEIKLQYISQEYIKIVFYRYSASGVIRKDNTPGFSKDYHVKKTTYCVCKHKHEATLTTLDKSSDT
jgi:hypothetical protein